MKTLRTLCSLLTAVVITSSLTTSCRKDDVSDDPTTGFSAEIQNIVPASIIDDLRKKGMVIHEGKKPPQIAGNYQASPLTLVTPYGPEDPLKTGHIIDDGAYKFYQQTTTNSITYDFKYANGANPGIGNGALIAGNGNDFTVFSEESGVSTNNGVSISYKTLAIISGELTSSGIRDFHYAFIIKEKTGDDSNKILIPVNTGRIWNDGDQLAIRTNSFRLQTTFKATNKAPAAAR
ncbi:hypothetical protein [Larkinella arboricola]